MKKLLSILLALTLLFTLIPAVFAASEEATAAADTLHALGLFNGTGDNPDGTPNYALDRALKRSEAVTMLVRLLGKEEEAKAGTWDTPFTDVSGWPVPYVGYAYANKLTSGTGADTFSGDNYVTATQYLTFVLRALGYDSSSDFVWNAAWELTDELGITHGEYNAENNKDFDRGNVVQISAAALSANMKGAPFTLAEKLIGEGVFTAEQYEAATGSAEDWQNPVMNFIGNYGSMEANTFVLVEAVGSDSAQISIEKVTGFANRTRWEITGRFDPETLTITYENAVKTLVEFIGDLSESIDTVEYDNGTGTIVFGNDGTLTWHEDQSAGDDIVFTYYPGN